MNMLFSLALVAAFAITTGRFSLTSPKPVDPILPPKPAQSSAAGQKNIPKTPMCVDIEDGKRIQLCGDNASYLTPLRDLLAQRGIDSPKSISIEVYKSSRLVNLLVDGEVVKTYMAGLGGRPDAQKTRRGDKATPIGEYYVCEKLPNSSYYLSLKLSYPNISDARRGLNGALIDMSTFNKIQRAIKARKAPPMNTPLGGDICIHGHGKNEVNWSDTVPSIDVCDWTAGCMAVNNAQMRELFYFVPLGTPVTIMP